MPKYRFLFKRLVEQYCFHEVEADSLEDAEEMADQIQYLDGSEEDVTNLQWQDDETVHAEYGFRPVITRTVTPVIDGQRLLQAVAERQRGED